MEKSEEKLTHQLENSIDKQLRDQLDLARQKRKEAEIVAAKAVKTTTADAKK